MHRFFIKKENIKKKEIIIIGEDANHISKVLRLKPNNKIVLCDGEGKDYIVSIYSIDKYAVRTKILSEEKSIGEADIDITVYQGIPKSSKMDFIIQKCTELGVSRIVPVLNTRTVVKLASEKEEIKKVERWQKIAKEAAKQSNRGKIPVIDMPMIFESALIDSLSKDLVLIPYEQEKDTHFKQALKGEKPNSIGIFIGPEGGFETSEIQLAINNKAKIITLGNRILRTETAAFVILSCILYEYDHM